MRFFEISANMLNMSEITDENEQRRYAERLQPLFKDYYRKHNEDRLWFTSGMLAKKLTCGYITDDTQGMPSASDLPWDELGLAVSDVVIEEIGSSHFGDLLSMAESNGYINKREVIRLFSIKRIWAYTGGFLDDEPFYSESIIAPGQEKRCWKVAARRRFGAAICCRSLGASTGKRRSSSSPGTPSITCSARTTMIRVRR